MSYVYDQGFDQEILKEMQMERIKKQDDEVHELYSKLNNMVDVS